MSFKIKIKGYDVVLNLGQPVEFQKLLEKFPKNEVIAVVFNGKLRDLREKVDQDGEVEFVTLDHKLAPEVYRHTMSHIMAQAVMRIYGKDNVRLGIGPTIENGFYYDFEILNGKITDEDLPRIEEEMRKIIEEDLIIERMEVEKDRAISLMKQEGQVYKVELINEIPDEKVTLFKQGEFVDLCRGPHMPSTGWVKHFKLLSVSGAYWRGDEKNAMLQRIYGTAFAKKEDLDAYLQMLEEAKKRDHRKLGPALGIFFIDYEVAAGMPIFLPNGAIILRELMNFSRQLHLEHGYEEVMTPLVMSEKLWRMSGHWDHYRENMYFTSKEEQNFAIKPMNCPGHILIYKSRAVSYRDLPIRYFEFGRVHRYERSGVLHGLFRVRSFTQDDAHIFCRLDQVEEEIVGVIELIKKIYAPFGFEYSVELSTMPENHMGDVEIWEKATNALKAALEHVNLAYEVKEGEGAFYGPKIDFHVKDSIGRTWQCATVQLDFLMPQRFELTYVNAEGKYETPVMIHRAIYGSLERFLGILIEHYAGAFPTWLAPVQVVVIPIADRHVEYAEKVAKTLVQNGIRVKVDTRRETLGYKIRDAQVMKIPYMFVVGDKEKENESVSVRTRKGVDCGSKKLQEVIDIIVNEIKTRSSKSLLEI
ncbi:Ser-tRNA(Thr) hydrolase; threonyl-tRNA synthetase [Pseudothermotoga thermarum DSM 5069]|uniref:Threonine--tRNA ligase n=1 Tax=Pseudothermotoga thermarum DSM 5069 TaxID=688269 RepID=F7YXG9_9THEM|nr:Ser-tRNA(Thr) hydrolase; threonyl-tRNA synthetase [Pseudothermotoga thermarum DSM 5069]